MTISFLTILAMLAGTLLLEGLARPRPLGPFLLPGRSLPGAWLHILLMIAAFGVFLAGSGNVQVSAMLGLAFMALLATISNAKHAVMGEPLLFSDLAMIGSIFRHPQFYLSAIKPWQGVAVLMAALGLVAVLAWQFVPELTPHLAGLAVAAVALAMLWLSLRAPPWRQLELRPHDLEADIRAHGVMAVLLLYWRQWRRLSDPPPCLAGAGLTDEATAELLVMVQCESFACPVDLLGDADLALPGLAEAQRQAWQKGRLLVSGFGANTMRTEYGVLFGRCETMLGFRRFDPFLTAAREGSYALPAKLKSAGWKSLFVHPHDMRFYNRDQIMPAAGFDDLIGEAHFAPPGPGEGRYVTDAAVADEILALSGAASGPTLIYAVTIENHGPWAAVKGQDKAESAEGYLKLVRNSDALLSRLMRELAALGRPAMLVFFGDHRPSIPGVATPGGERHTPYVILRMDAEGRMLPGIGREKDLTPADLHHQVLAALAGQADAPAAPRPAAEDRAMRPAAVDRPRATGQIARA